MTKARTLADLLDSSGDVKSSALDNATSSLSDLSVTATASELNTLDGITATTAELNLMDGVTATTTEINYLDGVTSNVQTQIDGISSDLVDDTTPQLGGDLDLNGADITGSGDINITGDAYITGSSGYARLEMGGSSGAYIDMKNPQSDDYDGRIQWDGNNLLLTTSATSGGDVILQHQGNNAKLRTTSSGIDVTGTITTDGFDYRSGTNQTLIIGNSGGYAGGEYGRVMFKEGNSELAKMQWNGTGNVFEVTNQVNGPLVLKTNNTERLKINGDGTWGKAPRGTVIQVLSDHEFGTQSYTGTGESTILSQAITPKFANSKILILASTSINSLHGYRYAYGKLYRGSTGIFIGNASGSRARVSMGSAGNSDGYDRYVLHNQHISFLDSPNTTSQVIYQIRMGNSYYNTTVYNNRPSVDTNAGYAQRGASSLIVMEIAQ